MAIEIQATPVFRGASAERFTKLMFANRRKKNGLTPVPNLDSLTKAILEFQKTQGQENGAK